VVAAKYRSHFGMSTEVFDY